MVIRTKDTLQDIFEKTRLLSEVLNSCRTYGYETHAEAQYWLEQLRVAKPDATMADFIDFSQATFAEARTARMTAIALTYVEQAKRVRASEVLTDGGYIWTIEKSETRKAIEAEVEQVPEWRQLEADLKSDMPIPAIRAGEVQRLEGGLQASPKGEACGQTMEFALPGEDAKLAKPEPDWRPEIAANPFTSKRNPFAR